MIEKRSSGWLESWGGLQSTVLLRTPITQMIFSNQGMLLLGSNHFLIYLYSMSQSFFESTLVTRRPYCPGRPKELCFTTLSLAMETMGMRLSVVKQRFLEPLSIVVALQVGIWLQAYILWALFLFNCLFDSFLEARSKNKATQDEVDTKLQLAII